MEYGDITDFELLDKELAKDAVTDKTGILDVKIRLNDGTTIDIDYDSDDITRMCRLFSKSLTQKVYALQKPAISNIIIKYRLI